jgi:hypothetical protein
MERLYVEYTYTRSISLLTTLARGSGISEARPATDPHLEPRKRALARLVPRPSSL